MAGVRKQLIEAEEALNKEKTLRSSAEGKLQASGKRSQELEANLEEADKTLQEKSSRQYILGFLDAKAQLQILYPELDCSQFGFMKKIIDGQVVGPADPDVSKLPFMQESDEEEEEEVEGDGMKKADGKVAGNGEAHHEEQLKNDEV